MKCFSIDFKCISEVQKKGHVTPRTIISFPAILILEIDFGKERRFHYKRLVRLLEYFLIKLFLGFLYYFKKSLTSKWTKPIRLNRINHFSLWLKVRWLLLKGQRKRKRQKINSDFCFLQSFVLFFLIKSVE